MKEIIRRLRRLENASGIAQREIGPTPADILRERIRLRAQEYGEPVVDLKWEENSDAPGRILSVAEILQQRPLAH